MEYLHKKFRRTLREETTTGTLKRRRASQIEGNIYAKRRQLNNGKVAARNGRNQNYITASGGLIIDLTSEAAVNLQQLQQCKQVFPVPIKYKPENMVKENIPPLNLKMQKIEEITAKANTALNNATSINAENNNTPAPTRTSLPRKKKSNVYNHIIGLIKQSLDKFDDDEQNQMP